MSGVATGPMALRTHRRSLGNLWMGRHCRFYFNGSHAATGDVNNVITASGNPVVTIIVAAGFVTIVVHAGKSRELSLFKTTMITIKGSGLAIEHYQVAHTRAMDKTTITVYQGRLNTKKWSSG